MEHLVNMALTPEERKGMDSTIASDKPEFPFGLTIHLDNDALKKLGINEENMPEAGSKLLLAAVVNVDNIEKSERPDKEPEIRMGLQIMEMSLHASAHKREPADIIFSKG